MTKKDKNTYSDVNRVNRIFGERVRQLRLMKGLTQEELGLQCGLHRTYIGQIERAEKNITLQSMYKSRTHWTWKLKIWLICRNCINKK